MIPRWSGGWRRCRGSENIFAFPREGIEINGKIGERNAVRGFIPSFFDWRWGKIYEPAIGVSGVVSIIKLRRD